MHSLLFFVIGISLLYVLVSAATGTITLVTWFAFGVITLEMVILLLYDWRCPLTVFAEDRGAISGSVADLFLPKWLSDHLFSVFAVLFAICCLLLAWQILG